MVTSHSAPPPSGGSSLFSFSRSDIDKDGRSGPRFRKKGDGNRQSVEAPLRRSTQPSLGGAVRRRGVFRRGTRWRREMDRRLAEPSSGRTFLRFDGVPLRRGTHPSLRGLFLRIPSAEPSWSVEYSVCTWRSDPSVVPTAFLGDALGLHLRSLSSADHPALFGRSRPSARHSSSLDGVPLRRINRPSLGGVVLP